MRKITVLSLSLLCSAAIAKPSTFNKNPWPMYQGNSEHTGFVNMVVFPKFFSLRWKYKLLHDPSGEDKFKINFPIAANNTLYVSTDSSYDDHYLFAIKQKDGSTLWKKSYKNYSSINGPSYDNGKIFIQTVDDDENAVVYTYDAHNGDLLFTSPFSAQWDNYLPATEFNNAVYIAGGTYGGAYSYDEATGKLLWHVSLPQYDLWTPTVDSKYVLAYVGLDDSNSNDAEAALIALDRTSGKELFSIPDPNYQWTGYSMGFSPVLDKKLQLAFVAESGYLTTFDLQAKNIRYSIGGGYSGQVVLNNNTIYADRNGTLQAVNETTGDPLWAWQPSGDTLTDHMIVTRNVLFVAGENNTYAINLLTHHLVWSYPVGGQLAISNNTLYIISDDSTVNAIKI